jgi:hypothetical protein
LRVRTASVTAKGASDPFYDNDQHEACFYNRTVQVETPRKRHSVVAFNGKYQKIGGIRSAYPLAPAMNKKGCFRRGNSLLYGSLFMSDLLEPG